MKQVQSADPKALSDHPLIAWMPMLDQNSPEFLALISDISTRGIQDPIRVTSGKLILDGRHRVRAAVLANLTEVPVLVCPDEIAADVVVASLIHRRHLIKGAIAYLIYPVAKEVTEEAVDRKNGNLIPGNKMGHTRSATSRNTTEWGFEKTLGNFAERHGIGLELLRQAKDVHTHFDRRPDYRARWEKTLMAGDIGLGGILQAIGGLEPYGKGQVKSLHQRRQQHDRLAIEHAKSLRGQLDFYDRLEADKQDKVKEAVIDMLMSSSIELQIAVVSALQLGLRPKA